MSDGRRFSSRFGFRAEEPAIRVREDAPYALRCALVLLADNLGLSPSNARLEVCGILLTPPDSSNWSEYPNVFNEVQSLIETAPWFRVYDIAEGFYDRINVRDWDQGREFELRLNELFREHGIGWEMREGRIVARGSEAFAQSLRSAVVEMQAAGRTTAAGEMHEALRDISRRPDADVSGSIQHAMAALECVARNVTGEPNKMFGQIATKLTLPRPLDTALEKLWGFASEQGRHLREGRQPRFEEAELVVTVASAVSVYLLRSIKK